MCFAKKNLIIVRFSFERWPFLNSFFFCGFPSTTRLLRQTLLRTSTHRFFPSCHHHNMRSSWIVCRERNVVVISNFFNAHRTHVFSKKNCTLRIHLITQQKLIWAKLVVVWTTIIIIVFGGGWVETIFFWQPGCYAAVNFTFNLFIKKGKGLYWSLNLSEGATFGGKIVLCRFDYCRSFLCARMNE